MTNLRKRLDNAIAELDIIKDVLKGDSSRYPPCCLTVHNDGRISCDTIGPYDEEKFLEECKRCRYKIEEFLKSIKYIQ